VGPTMTTKMTKAARLVPAMRGLPLGRGTACGLMAGKYLQMAVYGAAVAPVAEKALQRLRGAVLRRFGRPAT
ncbi:MAG: hypothetical protein ACKPKO_04875, partial [Candidatus Fonsibacter sp.]